MSTLLVKKLRDRIYQFTDRNGEEEVDAYFVIGSKKAVMIDGLENACGLYEKAREITDLPMEMVILHGHPDHAGKGCEEFIKADCPVYIQKPELPLLREFGFSYPEEAFTLMKHGDIFDLGDITLQVMDLPGHTPGSCVLYCKEENIMFSSDSLGSGDIWMWLPHSLPLESYRKNLDGIYTFIQTHPDMIIYPGHTKQIPDYRGDGDAHIDLAYVEDLMASTVALIKGEKTGTPVPALQHRMGDIDVRTLPGKIMIGYTYDAAKLRVGQNP